MHHRRSTAAALIALMALPLMACSSGAPTPGEPARYTSLESTVDSQDTAVSASSDAPAPDTDAAVGRSVIYTGEISVIVDDPAVAVDEVVAITDELDGFVASQTRDGESGATSAYLSIRIPTTALDDAFTRISETGEVAFESRSADDVTAQHVDLQARVSALQSSIDLLTDLMEGAATTGELIEAEAALSQRQQDLDGLQAQLDALEDQVDFATVSVSLSTEPTALPGGPANFWEGITAGFASLMGFAAGTVVVLGVLLPWLVVGAVVALTVILIVRASRRGRRSTTSAADDATPPA